MLYDTGSVAREPVLTLRADDYLRSVAWRIVHDQPLWSMLTNYWRKSWAFLFYPNVLLDDSFFSLRSLRIVLCAAALVAIIRAWYVPVVALAASVSLYQVVAHTPLLYNPRYAEGALDVWLPVLAGCGVAMVSRWPLRNISAFGAAVLATSFVGKSIRHLEDQVAPLHFNPSVPHRIIWQHNGTDDADLRGLTRDSDGNDGSDRLRAVAEQTSVRFPMPELPDIFGVRGTQQQHPLFVILQVSTSPSEPGCDKGRIVFRTIAPNDSRFEQYSYYPFRLSRDTAVQTFSFGVSEPTPTWVVPIDRTGELGIEFSCSVGGTIRFVRFALAESTYGAAYGRDPPQK